MGRALRPWLPDYGLIVLGGMAIGFGISALIVPARLAEGGLTGVAVTLHYLTGFGVGPLYAVLNVPLFAWAWLSQGGRFVWRTMVGVAAVSAAAAAFSPLRLPVHSLLLAALYGGLCIGAGVGLAIRGGGSSGGTDIIARFLNRRHGWSYSSVYLVIDIAVLGAVAVWVGLPAAMYAWIATNVSGRVVSFVVEGPRRGRMALIVTGAEERVAHRVVTELGRGATRLSARGAYTGQERAVLLVAAAQQEVVYLRSIVAEEDPRAFLVVLPATEVLGEGFQLLEPSRRPTRSTPR